MTPAVVTLDDDNDEVLCPVVMVVEVLSCTAGVPVDGKVELLCAVVTVAGDDVEADVGADVGDDVGDVACVAVLPVVGVDEEAGDVRCVVSVELVVVGDELAEEEEDTVVVVLVFAGVVVTVGEVVAHPAYATVDINNKDYK